MQNFSLVWKSCNSRTKNKTSSTTLESFNFPLFPSVTYPELEIWKSSSKNQGKKKKKERMGTAKERKTMKKIQTFFLKEHREKKNEKVYYLF